MIFISPAAFSAVGEVRLTTSLLQQNGITSNYSQLEQNNTSSIGQSVEVVSPTINKVLNFSVSTSVTKTDYSEYRVKNKTGDLQPLDSNYDGVDTMVGSSVSYSPAPYFLSVSYAKTVNTSPFMQTALSIESAYQFLHATSIVGIRVDRSQTQQPESYFGIKNEKRPTVLTKEKYVLSYEQIWSDYYKSKLEFISGARYEDRPRHQGVEVKNFYAFDARNSLRLDIGFINENKSEDLKSDRGYFKMNWFEVGYQNYISYRWQAGLGYGYLQEIEEKNPINNLTTQLINDLYAAKLAYLGSGWQAHFKLEMAVANTGARQESMQGGLQWEM